ncbi:MAG: FAD binding domain-containing protein, partial [Thermoanaerobaculia bacterium]
MLRLPTFDFRVAPSLAEAAAVLAAEGPAARLVAGGTDLWPNMKRRHQRASTVVSLMGLPELRDITANGDLRLGATAILDDVARHPVVRQRYPALARAVESISSPPLRNMATLGGNLCVDTRCTYYNQTEEWRRSIDYCMKEAGSVCWVAPGSPRCLAHTASDSAPVLCALGAEVELFSADGRRRLPVADLFRDDGIDYLTKRREEILTVIRLPASAAAPGCHSSFWKLRRRGTIDFAVLSVAAAVWSEPDGTVGDARVFLGAVGSRPLPVPAAAAALIGRTLTEETIETAAAAARKVATPFANTDFDTRWRGVMTARYTETALREIAGLPQLLPAPGH